ncbi:hypothetical protein AB0E69_12800 [Kribbella sp. NPDC026611]|uniref:hypothetical protein n=1 Tax=Kribbella sp. NPDC026611 TaxID=3154911 RepID=UPI00340262B6
MSTGPSDAEKEASVREDIAAAIAAGDLNRLADASGRGADLDEEEEAKANKGKGPRGRGGLAR